MVKAFNCSVTVFRVFFFLVMLVLPFQLPAETMIVIIGDSLTKGHGVSPEDAFPNVLEEMLRENGYEDIRVVNAGISGSTTSGGLKRLEWVMQNSPQIVIIALGANDGLKGKPVEVIHANLDDMIRYAKEKETKVILAGMRVPPNYGTEYREKYEKIFIDLAEEHKLPFIPFLLEGVAGIRALNLADGIHPNEDGHKIIAKTVYNYVEQLL